MNRLLKIGIIGIVAGSCAGCDQATKLIAQQRLGGRDPISLLSGMLRLSYVENPGAFLGLGAGLSAQARFWFFVVAVASGLVLLAALAVAVRTTDAAQLTAVAMMIGGGAGNLIDRVHYGVVRDFLNMGVCHLRTGIFNVANMAVTFGAVMLLADSWRQRRRRTEGCGTEGIR